jgi:hypothetical protein
MIFRYTVEVEVERIEGKFATADEIAERIMGTLEEAESSFDLEGIGPDGETNYEVISFSVDGGHISAKLLRAAKRGGGMVGGKA